MGTNKNPKRMTDLALRAERVRLKRQIDDLEKVAYQPGVANQISSFRKRRLELKDELHRRHLEREAKEQVESKASAQAEVADQPDLFMTADGGPYQP